MPDITPLNPPLGRKIPIPLSIKPINAGMRKAESESTAARDNATAKFDIVKTTARALARGDEESAAVGRGQQVGPSGTTIAVRHAGAQVVATASVEVHGPGGLLGFLPGAHLHATASAADEDAGSSP